MSSNLRITSSFLNGLKSLFPEGSSRPVMSTGSGSPILRNPWYIVAAVAFSASNRPEGVPRVFEHVLEDLRALGTNSLQSDEKLLAQKIRDALFKSGLISGYPKAINSLKALHEAMPDELKDKVMHRNPNTSLADYGATGQHLFRSVYGEKAGSVQDMLDSAYPDMGWFSKTIGYGVVYGHTDITSSLETSYTLVAALIAGDTPQQIAWHLDGAQRAGATLDEVRAVRELSIEVAKFSGIQWRNTVPEVEVFHG
ncbi:hypothetical protein M413DRAFT_438718 [Hebeloma cylindrosporum]|uniref:Carboxymuconolactone decarboxylase-like domain-containing protein n=1 Tax=Hebeloma cylindrosporum TaxID=76867 RepID=A0A0C3CZF1_HEBCY|nr:hypothetical protein M413DRAFT_438718 [Hebeloma cylindrosporum h7]